MRVRNGAIVTAAVAALMTVGAVTEANAQRGGSRPRNPSSSGGRGDSGGRSPSSRPSSGFDRPSRPSSFETRRPSEAPRGNTPSEPSWRSSAPPSLGSGRRGSEAPSGRPSFDAPPSLRERLRADSRPGLSSPSRPALPGGYSNEFREFVDRNRPENPSARRPRPDLPGDLDGRRDGRDSDSRPLPWYGYRPPVIWGPPLPPSAYYPGYFGSGYYGSGFYGSYYPYYSPFYGYDRYNRYWWDSTLGFYPNPPDAFPDITFLNIYGGASQASPPRTAPPGIDLGVATAIEKEPGAARPAGSLLLFPDYRTEFSAKETLPAPFAAYGVTPPYVTADAVLTAPWAYAGGREAVAVLPWEGDDPYVRADEARAVRLRTALNSLTSLWQDEDVRALRRYVGEKEPVAVFAGDRYLYSVTRDGLTPLVVDLLEGIETTSFRITEVKRRTDGLVTAHAQHRYRVRGESGGGEREMPVRMTLVYRGGEWLLTGLAHGGAL